MGVQRLAAGQSAPRSVAVGAARLGTLGSEGPKRRAGKRARKSRKQRRRHSDYVDETRRDQTRTDRTKPGRPGQARPGYVRFIARPVRNVRQGRRRRPPTSSSSSSNPIPRDPAYHPRAAPSSAITTHHLKPHHRQTTPYPHKPW